MGIVLYSPNTQWMRQLRLSRLILDNHLVSETWLSNAIGISSISENQSASKTCV